MSFSVPELRKALLADVGAQIAPQIEELRGASSVLPVLVGAEHKRRAAMQERLDQIDCEIEEAVHRRNGNARRLDSFAHPPKPAESAFNVVTGSFAGKRVQS